jgi:hypothetical protein
VVAFLQGFFTFGWLRLFVFAAAGLPSSTAKRRFIMGMLFDCFPHKAASIFNHFPVFTRTLQLLTSKPSLQFRSKTATPIGL